MTQNGKYMSLKTIQDIANNPKQKLAPNSFSEYLNTLAASRNTSLASCSAIIIDPIRKNLHNASSQIIIAMHESMMLYFTSR